MGWMGKVVGGGIGFVVGGPLGAVAGAVFGHMFDGDDDNRHKILVSKSAFSPNAKGEFTFYITVFSMLAKIAKADGPVTVRKREALRQFMTRDLRLNAQGMGIAEQIFNQALQDTHPFSAFSDRFYKEFHDTPEILEMMVDVMLQIASADGALHRDSESLVSGAVLQFRIPGETYGRLRARHVKETVDRHYKMLGCSPGDSNDALKRAYRKKVKEYHPDAIAAKDLPDDFVRYANNRFREIQESWDVIRRERNM